MTSTDNNQNSGGYVVRMPRPRQLNRAAAVFGAARFSELEDADSLVARAIEDGRLQLEWDYVVFDDDPMPQARQIPGLVVYGQSSREKDRTLSTKDVYDHATWRGVRTGRRPTFFESREAAEETVQERIALAEALGVVIGQLKFAQVVEAAEWEASTRIDPKDTIAQHKARAEYAVAKRGREQAAAAERAAEDKIRAATQVPPAAASDWHKHPAEAQIQTRTRSDDSVAFRARVAGKVSPTFDSVEQAITWRDQGSA